MGEQQMEYVAVDGYPDRPSTVSESLWKQYWDRRRDTQRYFEERRKATSRLQKIREQVSANKRRYATLLPPVMVLESMHPNGVIVHWSKPENWDPDDYRILVREAGTKEWRSAASSSITSETRKNVLTRSYLAWGEYREPYEITVEAIWAGVGNIAACPQLYPPVDTQPQSEPQPKPKVQAEPEPQPEPAPNVHVEPETQVGSNNSYLFKSGEVGGGRYGFTSITQPENGITNIAGVFELHHTVGVCSLFESVPGDGNGVGWLITKPGVNIEEVVIAGRPATFRMVWDRGDLLYYKAEANDITWPSREDRASGIMVTITTG